MLINLSSCKLYRKELGGDSSQSVSLVVVVVVVALLGVEVADSNGVDKLASS